MTVMKEKFVLLPRSLEETQTGYHARPCGEAPASVRGRQNKRKPWSQAYIVVSVERNWSDRVSRFRIG